MTTCKKLAMVVMAVALSACGGSKDTSNINISAINNDYKGSWVAQDKGLVIDITQSAFNIYRFTSDYCLVEDSYENVSNDDINQILNLANDKNSLYWFGGFGPQDIQAPGFTLLKQNQLPLSCANGIIPSIDDQNYVRNPELTFDIFSQIFAEYYLNFDLKSVDWASLVEQNGVSIDSESSDLDLLVAMDNMISTLSDPHNSIITPDGIEVSYTNKLSLTEKLAQEYAQANNLSFPITFESVTQQQIEDIYAYINTNLTLQKELIASYADSETDITTALDGEVFWFENEGLGYLHIGKMYEYHEDSDDNTPLQNDSLEVSALDEILDAALSDLNNVEGLIIDVRTNVGGHDFVSLAIASRFTSERIHAYTKYSGRFSNSSEINEVYIEPRGNHKFTGNIVLLTSETTNSAAEVFTLSMSQLPNVTLIGEATQGAFSDVMEWQLPNGFEIGLSSEAYLTPNGDWLEGSGVPVDIEVPFFTLQERIEEIDIGIETAVSVLLN